MTVKRSSSGLMRAAVLFCLLQVAGACGEVKDDRGPVVAGTGGKIDVQGGSSGVANGVGGRPNGEAGLTPGSAGGAAAASSAGAGHPGITAGTGGDVPELPNAGAMGDAQAGFAGASGAAPVVGFAADFTLRARAAMNSAAPQWTCATALANTPVKDGSEARNAVRAYIAEAVGVAPADLTMTPQQCSTPSTATCAEIFAHDTAKSGGSIYATARLLALELEANATAVEVEIWVPMKDGLTLQSIVIMSGIVDGVWWA